MLYDNAQLVATYLEGYQLGGDPRLAAVARDVLDYVAREMTSPQGAFYAATDADSRAPTGEVQEGFFFTWTPAELTAVLGPEGGRRWALVHGVSERGDLDGRSVPRRAIGVTEAAAELGVPAAELQAELDTSRRRLREARQRRPPPLRDDKILTASNGLMISALARAALVLGRTDYLDRARRAAGFVLTHLRNDSGRLLRVHAGGRARLNAYLDDYAYLIAGLLDLHEASHTPAWLQHAVALQAMLEQHHADAEHGGYFLTSDDHEQLLVRAKPSYDGAEPAGNSVAAMNLLRLEQLTGDAAYRRRAEALFEAFAGEMARAPTSLPKMLSRSTSTSTDRARCWSWRRRTAPGCRAARAGGGAPFCPTASWW